MLVWESTGNFRDKVGIDFDKKKNILDYSLCTLMGILYIFIKCQ